MLFVVAMSLPAGAEEPEADVEVELSARDLVVPGGATRSLTVTISARISCIEATEPPRPLSVVPSGGHYGPGDVAYWEYANESRYEIPWDHQGNGTYRASDRRTKQLVSQAGPDHDITTTASVYIQGIYAKDVGPVDDQCSPIGYRVPFTKTPFNVTSTPRAIEPTGEPTAPATPGPGSALTVVALLAVAGALLGRR